MFCRIEETGCVLCSFLAAMVVVDEDDKRVDCLPDALSFGWRGHTADVISSGRRDPGHRLAGLSDDVGVSLDKSACKQWSRYM
jgi:hypothetical protein